MFHYFYKITNKINGKFYYGVHNTNNLNDGYMGSGYVLKKAYKKYGIENFEKEIIEFFNSTDEAFEKEHDVVNEEMIRDKQCYNSQIGGRYFNTEGKVVVRDKNGKCFWVFKDDKLYLNGDLVPNWTGQKHSKESKEKTRKKMTPENSKNNRIWVNKDGKVKYLLKSKLDEYIKNGWELGRSGYKPRKNAQGKPIEQ